MNWQALIDGELPDSDLWLLSVFDRFSNAADASHMRKLVRRLGRLFTIFFAALSALVAATLRALELRAALAAARFIPPAAPRLPAAGAMLTPRLLPVPVAGRRG